MTAATIGPPRALVVGTGFGCRIQIPALRGAGFEVVGLVGADANRTAERAAASAVPASFTDLRTAIRLAAADAVVISTPPHTHAELAMLALELGCHVICEKPFARDAREARAMAAAAAAAGKVNALGNEFRYVPARAAVAEALAQGLIGEPRMASFLQLNNFLSEFETDFPSWWFDPAQGGGWLGASGSHLVDQVRTWLGEFDTVSASLTSVSVKRGEVDDSFLVRFRMKNGLEGVLQQSSGSRGPFVHTSRVSGSLGSVWIDGERALIADSSGIRDLPMSKWEWPPSPSLSTDPRQSRADWAAMAAVEIAPYTQLCRMVRAEMERADAPSPIALATFEDGVENMRVLEAIRQSAQAGGALVQVDQF